MWYNTALEITGGDRWCILARQSSILGKLQAKEGPFSKGHFQGMTQGCSLTSTCISTHMCMCTCANICKHTYKKDTFSTFPGVWVLAFWMDLTSLPVGRGSLFQFKTAICYLFSSHCSSKRLQASDMLIRRILLDQNKNMLWRISSQ